MTRCLVCWLCLLLVGCSKDAERVAAPRIQYPALDESPPPPAPPILPVVGAVEEPAGPPPAEVPSVVTGDGWIASEELMREQVASLREYAAKADPDDPFVWTEEDILEFEKRGNPLIQ